MWAPDDDGVWATVEDAFSIVTEDFIFETGEETWFFMVDMTGFEDDDDGDDDHDDDSESPTEFSCIIEDWVCIEYVGGGWNAESAEEFCEFVADEEDLDLEFRDEVCPEDELTGVCSFEGEDGRDVKVLFYRDFDLEDAEDDCDEDGGTFYDLSS